MLECQSLVLVLEFGRGRDLTRRFDGGSFLNSTAWAQTKSLIEDGNFLDDLAHAFSQIYGRPRDDIRGILDEALKNAQSAFTDEAPMQSYWYRVFKTLKEDRTGQYDEYLIGVKACQSHYLYTLRGRKGTENAKLLSSPFFERSQPPPSPAQAQGNLRGIADTILLLAPQIQKYRDRLADLLAWFDLTMVCRLEPTTSEQNLILKLRPELQQPSKCVTLRKQRPILMASQNFRDAIEHVADIWHNPSAKTILLCGSSGSGKEGLVDMLGAGMDIESNNRVDFSASELGTFNKFRQEMIAHQERLQLNKEGEHKGVYGRKSLLFLDEIHHKASEPVRSGVLRILAGNMVLKYGRDKYSCDHILFAFAASEPHDIVRLKKPVDLWSRMDHIVELRHPFFVGDEVHQREVLREYFYFFWNRTEMIQNFDWQNEDITTIVKVLSQRLEAKLVSPFLPLLSIRTLDKIVSRLVAKTKTYLQTRAESSDGIPTISERQGDEWLAELCNEQAPELNPEKVLKEFLKARGIF